MKAWSILVTILFLAAAGFAGWLYVENTNLKQDLKATETEKTANSEKLNEAKGLTKTLDLFIENYLSIGIDSSGEETLAKQIKDIGDRNLEVAYGNLKNAKKDEIETALHNFLAEFIRVMNEKIGGEAINTGASNQTEADQNKDTSSSANSSSIEGQGKYSDNVFPK